MADQNMIQIRNGLTCNLIEAVGNAKANDFWEAELPPSYDRGDIERFIRSKYVDRRWASKMGIKPILIPAERNSRSNEFTDCISSKGTPKRANRLSLDETSFNRHIEKIAPPPALRMRTLLMHEIGLISPQIARYFPSALYLKARIRHAINETGERERRTREGQGVNAPNISKLFVFQDDV
ncbi:hypothetical protein Cgig2_015227 [Carnegiea gigantea]|uniref:Uncharacterized protein n=1 Tax=Carnegiea gigantea TaxID=171969 RepID=A0A9Q1KI98_9CARY|nr:hypothetical protein Cgig2_015227 [Carnegiea gigantea]